MAPPDPKRLLELLRIAEHGSYTRAAAVVGVSQPALSSSMAVLERSLGVRLFDRSRHGADLTPFGRLLAGHAAAIDSVLSRAADELEAMKRGIEGTLVIGVSPIACVDIVPDAVARLKEQVPRTHVRLIERVDDDLLADLRSGQIDVMVSSTGPFTDPPEVERHLLLRDSFVAVMRPGHPMARRRSLALRDLRDAQWVLPSPQTAMWRQLEALFMAENEPWPQYGIPCNSVTALKALLMRTDTVSIVSNRLVALERRMRQVTCIPLRRAHFAREIYLRQRRGEQPPLTRLFIDIVNTVADEIRCRKT